MKKNRMKFLIIEFLLLLLAVFFVWKIFDQNVAEPRIAVILPESGDKRWDALIKGMKQAAAENNVHMIICNTEEIDGPEAEREFIREQKDNDIDGFIIYPAPGHETEKMRRVETIVDMSDRICEQFGYERAWGKGSENDTIINKLAVSINDNGSMSIFVELEKMASIWQP